MAMTPECRAAVNAAAGRELTRAELDGIDARLTGTARRLAVTDAEWRGLSAADRTLRAAATAMQDMQAEAARKIANAQRQALATAATEARIGRAGELLGSGRSRALVEDITQTGHYIEGVKRETLSHLMPLLDAVGSGQGASLGRRGLMMLFDAQNPQMTRDLVQEVFGGASGSTGNALAKQAAKAWLDTIESMRQRFNSAGGDVGKLAYGYLPQPHDTARVRGAGKEGWAARTLPLLDRQQYLRADGARMDDGEVLDFLRAAWDTLATDGINKTEPGQFKGAGARANRGSQSRQIHFKDGEAYSTYLSEYGRGSMYDAMVGHIGAMSRDIGLVERYGPNPEAQFRLQRDLAERADVGVKRSFGNKPEAYWSLINGTAGSPESATLAALGQHTRNIQVFGKLAGALLSSITDLGTLAITAGYNKLPYWSLFRNTAGMASKETREFLTTHGLIAEAMAGDLNRWAGEHLLNNWSGRLANTTMRLSLLNAWTDTLRRGFSMTMMQGLGTLSRKRWGELTEWDRTHLERKGLTEADWDVISRAELTDFRGRGFLTPEAIASADINLARPADMQLIRDRVSAQTAELTARNAQEREWISGRIDKFDAARDALNRQVKTRQSRRLAKNEADTGPLLERMAQLDAQREQAQLVADMEADFNRFATQDEMRAFLNAVEDGASADLTDVGGQLGRGGARSAARRGLEAAESIGRRYGEQKGRLERRMREIEGRVGQMDREARGAADADAKAAMKKADEMRAELSEFIKRSQERQQRRQAVIARIQAEEAPRLAEEARRIKSEVVAKVLGFITDESEFAVINPDLATRAVSTGGSLQAGTVPGELARLTMQFKSFPIAMISRHWRRMLEGDRGLDGAPVLANKAAYAAALMLTTTALGALAFQARQLVQGKDPVDMTTSKFWTRAAAQGGGAGFLGDIILGDTTDARSPMDQFGRMLLGPTFGSAADLYELTKGNIDEAAAGKDTHAGAEALRFARSHTPLINLWYGRAAFDRLLLHGIQENMSPGYLSRVENKAKKDWGQRHWWKPGEAVPDRGPDIAAIAGN